MCYRLSEAERARLEEARAKAIAESARLAEAKAFQLALDEKIAKAKRNMQLVPVEAR